MNPKPVKEDKMKLKALFTSVLLSIPTLISAHSDAGNDAKINSIRVHIQGLYQNIGVDEPGYTRVKQVMADAIQSQQVDFYRAFKYFNHTEGGGGSFCLEKGELASESTFDAIRNKLTNTKVNLANTRYEVTPSPKLCCE